jgi:threonine/homoserine/homoserine lactone efflux protein
MDILQSFLFGVTLAFSIGPIALLIINYGLTSGRRIALFSGLGAALADLTYALAGFSFGYGAITLLAEHKTMFTALSSCVLIALGIYLIANALKNRALRQTEFQRGPAKVLWTTYGLTMMNPLTILLFAAFAGNFYTAGPVSIAEHAFAVFAGSLLVQIILAVFGAYLGNYITNVSSIRFLNIISGAGIVLFGIMRLL